MVGATSCIPALFRRRVAKLQAKLHSGGHAKQQKQHQKNQQKETECLARKSGGESPTNKNLIVLMELRKKIMTFRDMFDIPAFHGSVPLNELLLLTGEDIHRMYPEFVHSVPADNIKERNTHEGLICFYEVLKCVGDSAWIEDHQVKDKFNYDNVKNLPMEKLAKIVVAILDSINRISKERFDLMEEDDPKRDYSRSISIDKISMDQSSEWKYPNSTFVSPHTPTSVLHESPKYRGHSLSFSPPRLWDARAQSVERMSPMDWKRLSFHMILQNQMQNEFCEPPQPIAGNEEIMAEEIENSSSPMVILEIDNHKAGVQTPSSLSNDENRARLSLTSTFPKTPTSSTMPTVMSSFPPIKQIHFPPPPPPPLPQPTSPIAPIEKNPPPPPPPPPLRTSSTTLSQSILIRSPPSSSIRPSCPPPSLPPPPPRIDVHISSTPSPSPIKTATQPTSASVVPPKPLAKNLKITSPQSSEDASPPSNAAITLSDAGAPLPPPNEVIPPPPSHIPLGGTTQLSETSLVTATPQPSSPVVAARPPPPPPPSQAAIATPPPQHGVTAPHPPPSGAASLLPPKIGGAAAPPPPMFGKGSGPPPPPLGTKRIIRRKNPSKLKRSSHMGNLYRLLKGKIEGSCFPEKPTEGKKGAMNNTTNANVGGGLSMADALAEMTRRSSYFQQIEEDIENHGKVIKEMQGTLGMFETKDMNEMLKFHHQIESQLEVLTDETQVLARFEGFPVKKLEALRTAASLYKRLDGILSELQNWKIESPLCQLLEKVESYFNKIKGELEAIERTKDEEKNKFQSHNIHFDFKVLLKIKEAMVDVSSSCMELALKERRDVYEAATNDRGWSKVGVKKKICTKMLWRAFQFAFKVYSFAGGQDERADTLTKELAQEIETDPILD